MKKNLAEAICKIIDQIIILKKEHSNRWPCYLMDRIEDDDWNVTIKCPNKSDMLLISALLNTFSNRIIEIQSNYKIKLS